MNSKEDTRAVTHYLDELVSAARTKWIHPNTLKKILVRPVENKEFFLIPSRSRLPKEFIRLEPWELEYLFSVATYVSGDILEIGRYSGGSTVVLASANKSSNIWSIDLHPQDDERLKKIFHELKIGSNVELIEADSGTFYDSMIKELDLLFIDGDHSYEGCMRDIKVWWPKLKVGGHMILHDCYLGSEVQRACVEFVSAVACQIIASPWKGRYHYRCGEGSLCHVIKVT